MVAIHLQSPFGVVGYYHLPADRAEETAEAVVEMMVEADSVVLVSVAEAGACFYAPGVEQVLIRASKYER